MSSVVSTLMPTPADGSDIEAVPALRKRADRDR
jgi:hypothetical protein